MTTSAVILCELGIEAVTLQSCGIQERCAYNVKSTGALVCPPSSHTHSIFLHHSSIYYTFYESSGCTCVVVLV